MNRLNIRILTAAFFVSQSALAAGAHGEGIPTVVFWQAANLALIAIGLYFFVGKKAVSFFKQKKSEFILNAEKSLKIRESAESKVKDIQDRLLKLEATSAESIERARAESTDLKKQLASEAAALAARIKSEASEAGLIETQKAKKELQEGVAMEAVNMARQVLGTDLTASDQQKLQDQFSKKIEGVRL